MDRTVTSKLFTILNWIWQADRFSYGTDLFYRQMFSLIEPLTDKEAIEFVDSLAQDEIADSPEEAILERQKHLGNIMCLRRTYSKEPELAV